MPSVNAYYFLFLFLCIAVVFVTSPAAFAPGPLRVAIREDEIAAKAMGINTRNVKLLAFHGRLVRRRGRRHVRLLPGLCLAGIVFADGIDRRAGHGGAGRHRPHSRRDLGGVILAALPEVLRHVVEPLQALFGHVVIEAEVLRQLLYGLAMVLIMLNRPAGLWPAPKHEDRPDGVDQQANRPASSA
jgi:branched-chain amino acid transport system permease protein